MEMRDEGRAAAKIGMGLRARSALVDHCHAQGLWLAEFYRPIKSGKLKQFDEDGIAAKILAPMAFILPASWQVMEYAQLCPPDLFSNIVVNAGRDHLLDVTLSGGTQDTTWFVGLTDGTPTVNAADTEGSHAGWVEVTAYTEANRVAWVDGGVSAQSVDNSASPATFSINGSTTVGGAFLSGDNTKGAASPATAVLYAAGAFTGGDRSLQNNDSIDVTATFTMSG